VAQTTPTIDKAEARRVLERVCIEGGELRFLLHRGQREALEAFEAAQGSRFVLEVARRWGKTWMLLVLAFMACMRKPKSRVVYGAPTLKHLAEFVLPTFEQLTERFPQRLAPRWNAQKSHIEFPNGSYIHLFGADDKHKADRGRGPSAELAMFDEAGFCPLLRYVLRSVFRPSLLHSGGRTIVASTPAELPDHDFTRIAELAEANGAYFTRDVWANPRLTRAQIQKFIEDDARDEGVSVEAYMESDDFQREYCAKRVVNRLLVAVPEWAEMRATRFARVPRPPTFRGHTIIDFGGNDPHAAIFGYFHPEFGFVVEKDLLLTRDERSRQFSDAVKAREGEVWGTDRWDGSLPALASKHLHEAFRDEVPDWLLPEIDIEAPPQPWLRITDIHPELARHFYTVGLAAAPVHKTTKQLMVQEFRNVVRDGQFWVAPEAEATDRHLRTTTWQNEKRKDWARRGGEHGDLTDCCVYFVRGGSRDVPLPEKPRVFDESQPMTALERRLAGRVH
jgi:hypothetical protein